MRDDTLHPPIKLLLQTIDEAYDTKAWYGPNLRQSIRGLTAKDAAWRPAPGRHNIWEIVLHAAYWKYIARRRLRGDRRRSFPLPGTNWFVRPTDRTEQAWRQDRALLDHEHRKLREVVQELPHATSRKSRWALVLGIACHDVYHAGQIRLLKRLRTGGKLG